MDGHYTFKILGSRPAFDKYKMISPPSKHNKVKHALTDISKSSIDL